MADTAGEGTRVFAPDSERYGSSVNFEGAPFADILDAGDAEDFGGGYPDVKGDAPQPQEAPGDAPGQGQGEDVILPAGTRIPGGGDAVLYDAAEADIRRKLDEFHAKYPDLDIRATYSGNGPDGPMDVRGAVYFGYSLGLSTPQEAFMAVSMDAERIYGPLELAESVNMKEALFVKFHDAYASGAFSHDTPLGQAVAYYDQQQGVQGDDMAPFGEEAEAQQAGPGVDTPYLHMSVDQRVEVMRQEALFLERYVKNDPAGFSGRAADNPLIGHFGHIDRNGNAAMSFREMCEMGRMFGFQSADSTFAAVNYNGDAIFGKGNASAVEKLYRDMDETFARVRGTDGIEQPHCVAPGYYSNRLSQEEQEGALEPNEAKRDELLGMQNLLDECGYGRIKGASANEKVAANILIRYAGNTLSPSARACVDNHMRAFVRGMEGGYWDFRDKGRFTSMSGQGGRVTNMADAAFGDLLGKLGLDAGRKEVAHLMYPSVSDSYRLYLESGLNMPPSPDAYRGAESPVDYSLEAYRDRVERILDSAAVAAYGENPYADKWVRERNACYAQILPADQQAKAAYDLNHSAAARQNMAMFSSLGYRPQASRTPVQPRQAGPQPGGPSAPMRGQGPGQGAPASRFYQRTDAQAMRDRILGSMAGGAPAQGPSGSAPANPYADARQGTPAVPSGTEGQRKPGPVAAGDAAPGWPDVASHPAQLQGQAVRMMIPVDSNGKLCAWQEGPDMVNVSVCIANDRGAYSADPMLKHGKGPKGPCLKYPLQEFHEMLAHSNHIGDAPVFEARIMADAEGNLRVEPNSFGTVPQDGFDKESHKANTRAAKEHVRSMGAQPAPQAQKAGQAMQFNYARGGGAPDMTGRLQGGPCAEEAFALP